MKLARKIVLVMLATFLGVFLLMGYVDARRVVREYHARTANDLATTGRALGPALDEVAAVEGRGRALQLLDRADSDLHQVKLRWTSVDDPALAEATRAGLARGDEVTVSDEASDHMVVYVPLRGSAGAIEISQELTPTRAIVTQTILKRFTVGGIAVLVAAILSIVAAIRIVGAPMRELASHARRIGSGDLAHRLDVRRRDEIGALATEMNTMCDRLAEAAAAKTKAEEQIRHADRMRTVGTLAAGMAHELGTPLGVIAGRAKMIATADGMPSNIVQYAQVIGAQVERMTKIIRGLLDFSRRTPSTKKSSNLLDLTKRILELLGPLAAKRNVVLRVDSEAEAALAAVDVAQVEQALANLVVNGIHAMERPGTVDADVHRVRATPPGESAERDYVRVSVRDAGSGIKPEDLPHIFEPFFTTKDVGEGTGLGLSVTYGIVHEHGGFVDVESALENGTCVSLYFPT